MTEKTSVEIGTLVSFISKKEEKKGKIVKIYQENNKTYFKIKNEKKYYFKQLKDIIICI